MTSTLPGPAAVELRAGLPVETVYAHLAFFLELRETGDRGLAFYLADMQARGLHQCSGHRSTVQFAQDRLGLRRGRAYTLIRVGTALRGLPRIHRALAERRVSWSHVVELARVVTAEHEVAWLARAEASTVRELRRDVRLARPGGPPRDPRDAKGLPEIRYDVRARIGALDHRKFELAKEKLAAERGEPMDDAALLVLAAELILGSDDDGSLPGRTPVDGSLYRIVLHAGASEGPLGLDTEDGPVALAEGSDCLLCDGECTSADGRDHDGVRDIATPPALRRRVLARDGHRCRSCGSRHRLMAHHIHHRGAGGRTRASNLITLCAHCHALVHADLLVLAGPHATRVRFLDAAGRPLAERLPPPRDRVRLSVPREPAPDESPRACPAPIPFEQAFAGVVGQAPRLARLRWVSEGSTVRGARFPHTLFTGPAGTGKTTFARALAAHRGGGLVEACGPAVRDVAALQALLAGVAPGGMLFLDEIHAVPRPVLEVLYQVMTPPDGAEPRLTVLAATTDEGDLPSALRSRFGLVEAFDFHGEEDLARLIVAEASCADVCVTADAARLAARCARGTPRGARRLLARMLDRAAALGRERITPRVARATLAELGFDVRGLNALDRRYLRVLRRGAGPIALDRLACILGVGASTLTACVEPFLVHRGLVVVTPRGRQAVKEASYSR